MTDTLLVELKKLQNPAPFSSPNEFTEWADQVKPLLSFDSPLQHDFTTSVLAASVVTGLRIDSAQHQNNAVALLNKAIHSLEVNAVENSAPHPPAKTPEDKVKFLSFPKGSALTRVAFEVFALVLGAGLLFLIRTQLGIPL